MRELTIDFNLENPLSGGCEAGFIGENNATKLIIRPSSEILGSGCSFLVAVFLTKGEIFRSEHFEPAETLEIMLGSHLTQEHFLSVQLEGYSEENMLLCKSPMVSKIQLMPSISGSESEIDADNYLLKTQIMLNSECRHNHGNSEVISLFDEKENKLMYKGKNVCNRRDEKSVVLSVLDGEIDAEVIKVNGNSLSIISYSDIESFAVPADAEIKSVELNIDYEGLPEWIDLRDMFNYDSVNPYIISCRKVFADSETTLTTVCKIYFINQINLIAEAVESFCLRKVRITYVENQAEEVANE